MADAAKSWGEDVGRINCWNTLGSCLGIVGLTFVGYKIPFFAMVLVIALFIYAMQEFVDGQKASGAVSKRWVAPIAAAVWGHRGLLVLRRVAHHAGSANVLGQRRRHHPEGQWRHDLGRPVAFQPVV